MERIGFIGLGIMGKPMALHLLKAGYPLAVLEKNKAAAELVEAGAHAYATNSAVAENSDIVITMLPDSPDVQEVVFGADGILQGIKPGSLFIDMSTIAPAVAKNLYEVFQQQAVGALDAPVSGGQVGAEAATLSIMVGGSDKAFARALPLFQCMGKNIVHIGEAGAGQTTKACNQMIVGMTIQAVAEAFTLAKKAGVNLEKMREVLLGGFAQSRILDLHGKRIIDQNFKPGFKIKLHRKDMNIILQAGKEYGVPLYGSALVAAHMDALIAQGNGELDHSALALLFEKMADI
ncbi:MAG: 2-hydroxy-3-oxopropionate reductase [Williamsia sp.]|nr:2-hydroxy-3-oxopropionate reductase [Williamsia sp.]